jgi:hypothetical protein
MKSSCGLGLDRFLGGAVMLNIEIDDYGQIRVRRMKIMNQ